MEQTQDVTRKSLFSLSKKPSLPSFTDVPTVRTRSYSLAHLDRHSTVELSPLLDDDPFANLSSCRLSESSVSFDHPTLSQVPRQSPIAVSPPVHIPPPTVARPRSSGHGQARPAHTRPAFVPRPSLPSLHTLALMDVTVPGRKIRKGTPGARLPHEPWNMNLGTEFGLLARIKSPPPSRPDANAGSSGTCLASREITANAPSLADETCCSRSLSGDDADTDSLPSLSYTASEPSSSALSRASSVASSDSSASLQPSSDQNSAMDSHHHASTSIEDDDDPLSYHSDFDYYTQSFSDPSDSEPDIDPPKPALQAPTTPYSSVYDPIVAVDPGSSPDTMRRVSVSRHHAQAVPHLITSPNSRPPQDGIGLRRQPSAPERQRGREDDSRGREAGRHNGVYSDGQSSAAFNGGAGGDDNNGDKARRGKPRWSDSSTSYTSSSDDDADGGTVYYSLDGMSNGRRSRSHSRTRSRQSKGGAGSDDDVPLAQQVPTALSAQKSIRRQLHDERQQRRLERARGSRRAAEPPLPSRPTELPSALAAPSRFRKRSMSAAPAPFSNPRPPITEPFPVEDLTRKLMNLQTSRPPPAVAPLAYDSSAPTVAAPRVPGYSVGVSRSSSRGKYADYSAYLQQKSPRVPEPSSQDKPLRSMRSFRRPDGKHPETPRSPVDQTSAPRLGRSVTGAPSNRNPRATRETPSIGYEQYPKSARVSEEGRRLNLPRSSIDRENDATQRAVQRQPVPPLPISDSTPPQLVSKVPVVQQRIFIGDMQRFNMVEITPATNAGDVIDAVARQGMLDRSGSWMVFEMAQDFGMERPIRDYELLSDVSASWNKDKLLNAFVIKQTPLAPLLSRAALPTSSPTNRGWVEWESKRGKWSKRWMELREHGLWLSKRETGKDEVFLCSLSNFDAYFVTRRHKAPKAFVFAIKSTDHLSMFENAADYLHVFCCNPSDGERWMQAVLVARSYVLYQERNVLFAKTGESLSQAKPLTRSRTRKQSVSRPAQPLVNVPPPFSQATSANVAFEPGSLLAKR